MGAVIGGRGLQGAGKGARLGQAGQIFRLPSVGHGDRFPLNMPNFRGCDKRWEKTQIDASHGKVKRCGSERERGKGGAGEVRQVSKQAVRGPKIAKSR
jgi:hypothetical protein